MGVSRIDPYDVKPAAQNSRLHRIAFIAAAICLLTAAGRPGELSASEGAIGKEAKAALWAEAGLKQVNYYLTAINPSVSNYGNAEEQLVFKHCVNRFMQAKILFLARRFNDSYQEIRRVEYLLIQLYRRILKRESELVHRRLRGYAVRIVYSNNGRARKFLELALRDLEQARVKNIMQHNFRPWLYLLRLNELVEALKLVRHANRYYVLLALEFDSVYPSRKEKIAYEEARRLITSGFGADKRGAMLLMHSDNYFKVGRDKKDLFLIYHNNPELNIVAVPLKGWALKYPTRHP